MSWAEPPVIVRPPSEILLAADHRRAEEARQSLRRFAELVKTPAPYHVYRLSRYSVWNALSSGLTGPDIVQALIDLSGGPIDPGIGAGLERMAGRFGRFRIERCGDRLVLAADTPERLDQIRRSPHIRDRLGEPVDRTTATIDPSERGPLKLALCRLGYPAEDRAGYDLGEILTVGWRAGSASGPGSELRAYQRAAVDAFLLGPGAGNGIVVLPCGAGKTLIGIGTLTALETATLILVPGIQVVRQWIRELIERTTLDPGQIGEYSGERKEIRPVTVATYPSVARKVYGPSSDLFTAREWGLIIYDEVHCLPAPVFRTTAGLQARRRLGLTATLVREDGREAEVFSLIGPKRYEGSWPDLTAAGWIAPAVCVEVRVPLPGDLRATYERAGGRAKARIAAINPAKQAVVRRLLATYPESTALVIGQYLDQLRALAATLEAPLITGAVDQARRGKIFDDLRAGHVRRVILSRVANQAIDLPAADLAIEVSGSFGSRQEEAQRLGRILRPKGGRSAYFYTVVSAGTVEEEYAERRQRFLLERGYRYRLERWDAAEAWEPTGALEANRAQASTGGQEATWAWEVGHLGERR